MADGDKDPGKVDRPTTEGVDSIWSTDDIPVRDGPLDLVWAPRTSSHDASWVPAHPNPMFDTPVAASPPDGSASDERRPRPKLLLGGAALVAVAVVVGVLVRSGGSDESAAPHATTDAMPTADAATPDPPTSSEAPVITVDTRDSLVDATTEDSIGPTEVELPPSVAAIRTPTEIVMLTADGLLHTLSLPSGRVRSVALADTSATEPSMFSGDTLVVAPESTAILQASGGGGVMIVPRVGPPIDVAMDAFGVGIGGLELRGWVRAGDGSERFVVVTYPNDCCDPTDFTSVGRDGDVVALPTPQAVAMGFGLTTANGTWIVNDAGGSYEIDGNGTHRIESGVVQAATRDHRLVRECDDALHCSTVLVRVSDGERRVIDPALLLDDFYGVAHTMSLSPDGSALAVVREGPTADRVLIDLDVGEVAAAPLASWPQGSTWAADSSGLFDSANAGPGLRFIGRNGETVGFGPGLEQVIALGVRWPDAELDPDVVVVSEPVITPRPIGPTGITVVGAMTSGGMTYIDIDAAVRQSWATTERLGGDLTLIKSADAVLAFGDTDEPAFAFHRGVQERLDDVFAVGGQKLPGPIEGSIWVPSPELEAHGRGVAYRLVTSDGLPVELVGAVVDLPDAELIGSDGRGGLVVVRAGDVFVVGVDGTERLTSGDLIAIAADTAYVRECADVTTCDIKRIERQSGARSTLGAGIEAEDLSAASGRGAALGSSVSPDGEVVIVQVPDATTDAVADTTWSLVDTTRERPVVVTDFEPDQPLVWSADSNFAALLADSTLFLFDRAAGELVPLSAPKLKAIGQASLTEPAVASG